MCGKFDTAKQELIPSLGQLSPSRVQKALSQWLQLPTKHTAVPTVTALDTFGLSRKPYFCSGCPHSSSTKVPEGSKALAGVGCHYMASWMDRSTQGLTQMGGEGVQKVVITTDEPERYKAIALPTGIEVLHRRELDRIQRELREIQGVTKPVRLKKDACVRKTPTRIRRVGFSLIQKFVKAVGTVACSRIVYLLCP